MSIEEVIGEVVKIAQAAGLPPWAVPLLIVLAAVLVVVGRAVLPSIWTYLKNLPPAPPRDEHGQLEGTGSKPMDMPAGGMPVPGPPNEP